MQKPFFVILFSAFSFCSYGQINWGNDSVCFEKCNHARLANTQQRAAYYQYPSMNKYDVKYLKLDLNVEPNNRAVSGTALTRVRALQTLDSFIIELKDNMIVDSVLINGVKQNFQRGNHYVFIPLLPVIPPGSLINILFYYRGLAGPAGIYAGVQSTSGLVYTATLSESYQSREWFPAKQILRDKIDSADIWLTTSDTNLAGSNGLLQAVITKPGSKKQFQWKTRYPMAYYLAFFAVANYMEYKNYAKPAAMAPDSILVQHYIANNPAYFSFYKSNLDKTPAFLEKMSELFGLYPFKNEKYGHAHAVIGGGMEHQTMSTMSSFGTQLIAHELGHQWFGDNVTCATWNHIWINEGFASYADYLMLEKLPVLYSGVATAADYMQIVHNDVLMSASGSVFVPDSFLYNESRIFNFRLTYNKGSAIIHTLRFEVQNDNIFFQSLKNFQQQFKDSVATADNLKQVVENTSGKNLTDFFNQWYYGEGYPTFNVDYSKHGDSLVLLVNQNVSAPNITSFFKGLYEFTINSPQGDTTVKFYLTRNNQVIKFRSNKTPSGVVVDPDHWVLNKVGLITTGLYVPPVVSNNVKLYPNPSSGIIYLEYPMNWFDNLQVYDVASKLLKQETISRGSSQVMINTGLVPGTYIMKLYGKDRLVVKKLIVAQ